jgi:hypothetical protein
MALAYGMTIDKVALQLARHRVRTSAAVADEADAPACEPFDGRNANLLIQAFGYDLPFIEVDKERAAHFLAPRLAAATASRRLL